MLPTGGGKSLCFQAPARGGVTGLGLRCVSPLISLMKDQVDGLRVDGVAASFLNSTLLPHERDEVLASVREDRCRLLYVSPERLVGEGGPSLRRLLQQCEREIRRDRRSALHQPVGPRFPSGVPAARPAARRFPGVSLHAFTATATGAGPRATSCRELRLQRSARARRIVRSAEPRVSRAPPRQPAHASCIDDPRSARRRRRHHLLLVAAGSRGAGRVAAAARGTAPLPYHAGLADDVRSRHQETFLDERVDIVVATGRVRDGDRPVERAVRRARRRAAIAGALSAGVGPRGTRRAAGGVRPDLLGRRLRRAGGRCSRPTASGATARATLLRDMERYAAGTRCRHRTLVEYFGAALRARRLRRLRLVPRRSSIAVADSRTVAQKILSCVARVKQTWGTSHVADVLIGTRDREGRAPRGIDALSTFGLLKEESAASRFAASSSNWSATACSLREGDPYPVLRLTTAGASLLRGEGACRAVSRGEAASSTRKRSRSAVRETLTAAADSDLFDVLRDVRLRLRARARRAALRHLPRHDAARHGGAAAEDRSRIFTRSTASARRRPPDFGDAFLDAIRTFGKPE